MFTRLEWSAISERLCNSYLLRTVHHAFCSPENGIADLICIARYRFRDDDPPWHINDANRSQKVGFWHVYASRISTSRRFSSLSTKLPIQSFTLQSISTFSACSRHKNSICGSAVTRFFFYRREAQWNSNFDFDVEFTEREMRKPEWECLHANARIWTKMPLCGGPKWVSRHLDIVILLNAR